MGKINKVIMILVVIVIFIFGILFFTIPHDSDEDLVGEIEEAKVEVELFMLKITEVEFFEGEYDSCIFLSTSVYFEDMDIMFDYVKEVCSYRGYLIFESQGVMYITNGKYVRIGSIMIDDISGLGGVL